MKFNNLELNTEITITESKDGELFFNLHEIARNLKYLRPNKAVNEFVAKHSELESENPWVPEDTLFEEWVLYLFLMESNASKAIEFKKWVAQEVLPTIRKVGMSAIKELEAVKTIRQNKNISLVDLSKIVSEERARELLVEQGSYREFGYLPPSDFGVNLFQFYQKLISEKYLTPEGDLIRTDMGVYCMAYTNNYVPNGKWYAWKPEVADLFSTPSIEKPRNVCTLMELSL